MITFRRLQAVSFTHSTIYLALLVVAFALNKPQPETFILGMAHGVRWIGMALVCTVAAIGAFMTEILMAGHGVRDEVSRQQDKVPTRR